jgi:pimeloyl-ACP methyl ester carboxylesterase
MKTKVLLSFLLLTFLLVSCNPTKTPDLTPPDPAPTSTTVLIQEHMPSFEPAPCPFDVPQGAPVDCGFVIVPEDHNEPGGPKIRIALAILRDQSFGHKPDPVIFLAGGPGERVVSGAIGIMGLFAPTIPNRDLILFDQRGVGLSEPALECPELEQTLFDMLDETDPEEVAKTNFNALLACRDQLVSEGHALSMYNNLQNAADVNAIRLALGYNKVNLYGGSYGSLLAQSTARDYPEGIRSMVIWSVVPLEKSLFVDSTTTTANAVIRLLDECKADEACSSAYPDLENVLFELIDRLNAEPVSITVTNPQDGVSHDAWLTGDGVVGNLVGLLYQTQLIPAVPQAIYDVHNRDYALMTQLAGANLALYGALSRGMEFSVLCTDDLIGRSPDEILEFQATLPRQFVGRIDPEVAMEYSTFSICERWPVEEAAPWVKEPLVSDIPTLALGAEFDQVTPPEYGNLVTEHLSNSYIFEFPGIGHNIIVSSDCARGMAGAFLDDPSKAPDSSCIDEMPGLVFDVPGDDIPLVLEPFTDVERGFSGLVPAGWQELAPANLMRGNSALDQTYFVLEAAPSTASEMLAYLASQLEFDPELEPITTDELGNFIWDFYTFERGDYPADLAMTEEGGVTYFVFMLSSTEEHDFMYDGLFLPAVEAMRAIGPTAQ